MRVRSLGQLRVFSLRSAGKFSSAWHPFGQASLPFFAQPGHETDRRSVAEDPQPIGGVTADFGRVDEGASPKASPPRPSSNRVYRFPVDGSPANFSAGLSSFELISLWDIHPSDGRGPVAFAAQLFLDSGEEFIHSVFPGQHGFCHDTIEPLSRINLLAGLKNTEKTAVLETLMLLVGRREQAAFLPSLLRSSPPGDADAFDM